MCFWGLSGEVKHSTKAPTKFEQLRFEAMSNVGCCACWLEGRSFVPGEVNHIVKGRKRLGHLSSYLLCAYHHRNVPPCDGLKHGEAEERFGPSLAHSPKAFHEKYGSDEELLELQNKLIEGMMADWTSCYS